ncbi:MAG: sodium:proton symporter [Pseudomonadota bacterium]
MNAVRAIIAPIDWIGRQGTRAIAASLFLGMAFPAVSAVVKPIIPFAVFALLLLALLRIDPDALRKVREQKREMLLALLWSMLVIPFLVTGIAWLVGLQDLSPPIMLALTLMASAPPIMSVAGFCFILGLNGTMSLVLLIICLIVTPITSPLPSAIFLGESLPVDPWELALRLFIYLAGALVVATIIRRVAGQERLNRNRHTIDGLNVLALFIFAVALMDGVTSMAIADPRLVASIIAMSFLVAGGIVALTMLAFLWMGRVDALSIGLVAGNRNMGLMASVLITGLPDLTWVYFALAQFPIYLLPWLMGPISRWARRSENDGVEPAPLV